MTVGLPLTLPWASKVRASIRLSAVVVFGTAALLTGLSFPLKAATFSVCVG